LSTKYEEMCEAALEGVKRSSEYRENCWRYMETLVRGFISYAVIPEDRITLLKWNGFDDERSQFAPPENGGVYTMAGATVLGKDGFWRLGLRILLPPMSKVWFAFFVAEQEGRPVVKIGDKTFKVNLESQESCIEVYDYIVKRVTNAFAYPKKPNDDKAIGFVVETTRT